MCLVVIDWQPDNDNWLNLVSNRDEFFSRLTLPLQPWKEEPSLYAGIDVEHKGSWLGFNKKNGRFAVLTNVRAKGAIKDGLSRGQLVKDVLTSTKHINEFAQQTEMTTYSSFNLLIGDKSQLFFISNYPKITIQYLNSGVYTLSNGSLNTAWPKAQAAKESYLNWRDTKKQDLIYLLSDPKTYPLNMLPNTGVPKALEQQLSAQFICLEHYGTRSSHSLIGYKDKIEIREIQWDKNGQSMKDTLFNISYSSKLS